MKKFTTFTLVIFTGTILSVYLLNLVSFNASQNRQDEKNITQVSTSTVGQSLPLATEAIDQSKQVPELPKTPFATPEIVLGNTDNSGSEVRHNSNNVVFRQPAIDVQKIIANMKQPASGGSVGISLDEVARHNSVQSCYLAINGNVYDVTSYLDYHPAGPGIILENCGKEVTGLFASIHSNRAWDLLARYKIGKLAKEQVQSGALSAKKLEVVLSELARALKRANPGLYIVSIKPTRNGFLAKVEYQGAFYELHINNSGKIVQQENENVEKNWEAWSGDLDDRSNGGSH